MSNRSPEEIRASIEANRLELGDAVEALTREVRSATDWRRHVVDHQKQVMIGAGAVGFVLAGGFVAFGGLFSRR